MADLSTVDGDPCEPPSHDAVITLANRLLSEFNIQTRIQETGDINASLFVVLYESLFSDRLPGIIRQPVSKEDEIHNCQIVIDVLSTDVVRDSLSHIRGADIVAGDLTATYNLLDIFSYLLEYVVNKIESDVDHDDTRSIGTTESEPRPTRPKQKNGKPTTATGVKKISEMPKSMQNSLAKSNRTNNNGKKLPGSSETRRSASLNKNANRKAFEDHKIISHEDFYAMAHGGIPSYKSSIPPSPIKPDQSQSLLGQKTIDSDFDLDTEKIGKVTSTYSANPKIAWDEPTATRLDQRQKDRVFTMDGRPTSVSAAAAVGAATTATTTPGIGLDKTGTSLTNASFSASMPHRSRTSEFEKHDPLRSTVGPITYHSYPTPEKPKAARAATPQGQGLSSSYNDLRHLVEKTAALTRIALETSPIRGKSDRDLDITDVMRDRPRPTIPSEGVRLARELNAVGLSPGRRGEEISTKPSKKVAFVTSNSEARLRDRFEEDYSRRPLSSLSSNTYDTDRWMRPSKPGYTSDLDSRTRNQEMPPDRQQPKRGQASSKAGKTGSLAQHLARNRQPELGAAHMTLKTEDRAIRKKQEILRKFFEKDYEEFAEDVDYMLGRDNQKAKEREEEYVKRCSQAASRQKPGKKAKGPSKPSTCKKPRISKVVSSKAKRRGPRERASPPQASSPQASSPQASPPSPEASPPVRLECEEDLLPFVLDEFPHLHLSEHTWHELWRKGLHQIEALTRTYQESQRKKSRAQSQLEEAAEKHDLLSNIMRKQLEHSQRMRDIKEQKQQQIQIKNKTHEKRMQSARARRYYNEYQVRARAKQLKKRTKEEMVFRELFKEALNIQRERIKDIRQYATDQRKKQEKRRQNEIDSLENFYQDQFEMLADRLAKERMDSELRDAAQQQMMERMKRELRKKMESEIKLYQEQAFRDDDDAHFRQMDADRVKQRLHTACYQTNI